MPPRHVRLYYAILRYIHVYVIDRQPVPVRHARFALDGRRRSTMAVVSPGRTRSAGSCRVPAEMFSQAPPNGSRWTIVASFMHEKTESIVSVKAQSIMLDAFELLHPLPPAVQKKNTIFF